MASCTGIPTLAVVTFQSPPHRERRTPLSLTGEGEPVHSSRRDAALTTSLATRRTPVGPRGRLATPLVLHLGADAIAALLDALGHRAERPMPCALPDELGRLSARELTVLRAMATGASNAEIAAELFVSVATVKTHVRRILAKLEVRDRVQAVVFAYESRLVTPRGVASGQEAFP
jgi:DNA-binding CsgD family transcriptional regulator